MGLAKVFVPMLLVNQRSDADLASDTCHARSSTGLHVDLRGPRFSRMMLDWASRRQSAPARNTADAGGWSLHLSDPGPCARTAVV